MSRRLGIAIALAFAAEGAGCATEHDQWEHRRRHHLVVYEFPRAALDAHPDDRPELAGVGGAGGDSAPADVTKKSKPSAAPASVPDSDVDRRKGSANAGAALSQLQHRAAHPTDPEDGPARMRVELTTIDARIAELEGKVERGPDNAKDNVRGLVRQIRGQRRDITTRIDEVEALPPKERKAELVEIYAAYLQTEGLLRLVESWYDAPGT